MRGRRLAWRHWRQAVCAAGGSLRRRRGRRVVTEGGGGAQSGADVAAETVAAGGLASSWPPRGPVPCPRLWQAAAAAARRSLQHRLSPPWLARRRCGEAARLVAPLPPPPSTGGDTTAAAKTGVASRAANCLRFGTHDVAAARAACRQGRAGCCAVEGWRGGTSGSCEGPTNPAATASTEASPRVWRLRHRRHRHVRCGDTSAAAIATEAARAATGRRCCWRTAEAARAACRPGRRRCAQWGGGVRGGRLAWRHGRHAVCDTGGAPPRGRWGRTVWGGWRCAQSAAEVAALAAAAGGCHVER